MKLYFWGKEHTFDLKKEKKGKEKIYKGFIAQTSTLASKYMTHGYEVSGHDPHVSILPRIESYTDNSAVSFSTRFCTEPRVERALSI